MTNKDKLYIFLSCLFCSILVTGNLIFQKFVVMDLWFTHFEISAGTLLFPIGFLIGNLITEFYGKNHAITAIKISILCCLIILIPIIISDKLPATSWSRVDNTTFHKVFNAFGISLFASITANSIGQYVDIIIYELLKNITKSNYLWLKNGASLIIGQIIDTFVVTFIVCLLGAIPWSAFAAVVYGSVAFKVIFSILITPLSYAGYYFVKVIIK